MEEVKQSKEKKMDLIPSRDSSSAGFPEPFLFVFCFVTQPRHAIQENKKEEKIK
jgi:hypothetical protein